MIMDILLRHLRPGQEKRLWNIDKKSQNKTVKVEKGTYALACVPFIMNLELKIHTRRTKIENKY